MTFWTDEPVADLREFFADGLSGNQMAVELRAKYRVTLTRNAVISKLQRLGLTHDQRPPKSAHVRSTRFRPPAVSAPPIAPPAPAPADEPAGAHRCELLELTNEMCRYPITDEGPPHVFCGNPGADLRNGVAYCSIHRRMAYRRPGDAA